MKNTLSADRKRVWPLFKKAIRFVLTGLAFVVILCVLVFLIEQIIWLVIPASVEYFLACLTSQLRGGFSPYFTVISAIGAISTASFTFYLQAGKDQLHGITVSEALEYVNVPIRFFSAYNASYVLAMLRFVLLIILFLLPAFATLGWVRWLFYGYTIIAIQCLIFLLCVYWLQKEHRKKKIIEWAFSGLFANSPERWNELMDQLTCKFDGDVEKAADEFRFFLSEIGRCYRQFISKKTGIAQADCVKRIALRFEKVNEQTLRKVLEEMLNDKSKIFLHIGKSRKKDKDRDKLQKARVFLGSIVLLCYSKAVDLATLHSWCDEQYMTEIHNWIKATSIPDARKEYARYLLLAIVYICRYQENMKVDADKLIKMVKKLTSSERWDITLADGNPLDMSFEAILRNHPQFPPIQSMGAPGEPFIDYVKSIMNDNIDVGYAESDIGSNNDIDAASNVTKQCGSCDVKGVAQDA